MIVNHIFFLLFLPSVLTDIFSDNDIESQIHRKTEDIKSDDGIITYGASLQDVIRHLQKELKATKSEVTKVKEEVKQVTTATADITRFSKEIDNNKKEIEDIKTEIKSLRTNMKETYNILRDGMKGEFDSLRRAVSKNAKDIASSTKADVTSDIKALKKDFQSERVSVSARLDSVTGDLSSLRKSYKDLKLEMKNFDSLKDEVKKNSKDISSNTNKLQGEITQNIADIKGLKKDTENAKATSLAVSSRLTSVVGDLSSLTKSYDNLKLDIKNFGSLKDEIKKNTKSISTNTDKLQGEITKNIADIQGLKKDYQNDKTSVSSRLTSLGASITSLTKSYNSLKLEVKSGGNLKALKTEVDKNRKAISSSTKTLQIEISKNIADIQGISKEFKNEKSSVSTRLTSVSGGLTSISKTLSSLTLGLKNIGNLKNEVIKNQKAISANTNKLQGEISKNIADIQGLTKSFGSEKTSVSKQLSTISGGLSSVTKSYNSFQNGAKKDIGYLKAAVTNHQQAIISNSKNLQRGISKNGVSISGMKKDISGLSSRLTSEINGLSNSWKAWFANIQKAVKKNIDGLTAGVNNNRKAISTTGVTLQGQITKNTADIRGLNSYFRKELAGMSVRVNSITGKFTTVYAAQANLEKDLKKDIAALKDGVVRNTKVIYANTNSLQGKITKNAGDIQGIRNDMKKQVSSVSTHLTTVVKGLTTKITSFTMSTKAISDRIRKGEIGISKVANYAEGVKNALASTAQIVFYPKGTTTHFSYDVYRDFNAHFFAYGWPHKYDKAHNLGNIGLKACIRGCHRMKKRDGRWKAIAYYSEGSHCWCYMNPRRTIEPHTTVLTYMLM